MPPPAMDRELNRNVDREDVSSEEEDRAKGNGSPGKGGPSGSGKSGRKKSRKKKKKKKASQDQEKPPSQHQKRPLFLKPSFDPLRPLSEEGITSGPSRGAPGQTSTHPLLASTSALSFLSSPEDTFTPSQESLRWDGALEDPVAEEERLWHYRVSRRKRYGDYLRQNLPPEPSFTLRNLPELCQVAPTGRGYSWCRSESPPNTSEADQP